MHQVIFEDACYNSDCSRFIIICTNASKSKLTFGGRSIYIQISITVAGSYTDTQVSEKNTEKTQKLDGSNFRWDDIFYIGGIPDSRITKIKGNKVFERFVGCLKNVVFSTGSNDRR